MKNIRCTGYCSSSQFCAYWQKITLMKYLLGIVCFFLVHMVAAQKNDNKDLYPLFKTIKIKWPKETDVIAWTPPLDQCISGNCSDGEGVRIKTDNLETKYSNQTLYCTLLKGKFSEAGNRFNGKIYKLILPVLGIKKEKELRINPAFDLTDETALKQFCIGEGPYYFGPESWFRGWDGEVKNVPEVARAFPGAEMHRVVFSKGSLSWMDITLPETHRFLRYTGHTFASGDFMFGKAQLKNGDVYEGFFLRHSFHGPGKLITSYGKTIQGIWQLDALVQDVTVEFPAALLQPLSLNGTKFKISQLNGLDVNCFRRGANDVYIFDSSEYYGEVVNNEASGWGLWKTKFTNGNADARDDVFGLAYGKWKHNQLDGPGIYFTTPTAYNLSFSGNKSTSDNDFWIQAGLHEKGNIVQGHRLTADYSVYYNQEKSSHEIQTLHLEKMILTSSPLEGCGLWMDLLYQRNDVKPSVYNLKEGYFSRGQLSGFYFENDTAKKRSYELLHFAGYNPYQPFTESVIKTVEASNDFCFDAISKYKPLYVAEMKKKFASNLAAEQWAKSPEGLAHKRQVELYNKQYEDQKRKECDAEFAKVGVKGRTYLYDGDAVVLEGFDCEKKEFIVWRPWQQKDGYDAPRIRRIKGNPKWDKLEPSSKQYHTCADCDGTGKIIEVTSTTRTKELPWGYFSGIETRSIRTTTKEEVVACKTCKGLAIVLK